MPPPNEDIIDTKLMRGLMAVMPVAFAAFLLLAVLLGLGDDPSPPSTIFLFLGTAGALGTTYTCLSIARIIMHRRRNRESGPHVPSANDAS